MRWVYFSLNILNPSEYFVFEFCINYSFVGNQKLEVIEMYYAYDFVQPYSETRLAVEEYVILQQSQYTDSIDSVVSQEWSETARRQQQRYT